MNAAGLPGKPFLRPLPWATTLLALPWKRLAFEAPGFFSTVSTNNPDVSVKSEAFPLPKTKEDDDNDDDDDNSNDDYAKNTDECRTESLSNIGAT